MVLYSWSECYVRREVEIVLSEHDGDNTVV